MEAFFSWFLTSSVDLTTVLVFVTTVLLSYVIRPRHPSPGPLPPGPRGVPFLGVLPLMGKKPYLTLQRWWKEFGDVYSAYMGSRLVIVLNGKEAFRECFIKQGENFTGRPWMFFKKVTNNTGLMFTDGDVWREHRRFALKCLRDFGMGTLSMERRIIEESSYVLGEIDTQKSQPFDIKPLMMKAFGNIILSVVFGSRFEYDDPIFQANLDALDQSARRHTVTAMANFMPYLESVMKMLPQDPLLQRNIEMRDDFAAQKMREHKETYDRDNPRDLIDAYFARMDFLKGSNTPTTFEDQQLKRTIQDLFITGTQTMTSTMTWMLLFMAWHPEIQVRVQQEIDHVIGNGRSPAMADRAIMPYTEATIMECQRLGNISMFNVPRCTLEATTVQGYHIPKGTWVMTNRWGMHASSDYWDEPTEFRPERFLQDGKVHKPEAFVPFGMGPRSCLGEVFARIELFLFFTAILQRYSLRLPAGAPEPTLEPVLGINLTPQPYQLVASHRD